MRRREADATPQAWIFFALHLTAFAAAARSADDMRPEDRSAPPPGSAGRRFVVFGIRTGSKLSNCVWKFLTKYDTLNIERETPACVASACLGKEREHMKRRRRVLLLSLALCLLAGCASSADGSAEAAGGGSGLSAALLEEAARPLAEEEILAAYDRALEAYGWFYLETLPAGQEAAAIGGWIYHRVDYPGMETLADLRAYLRGSFTEELTDELLSTGGSHPLYQDVEGELYVLPSSRDRDSSKGQITVGVEPYGQAGYSVMVSVDLLDAGGTDVRGVQSYAFPYEFVEDRWVFTDFQMVY